MSVTLKNPASNVTIVSSVTQPAMSSTPYAATFQPTVDLFRQKVEREVRRYGAAEALKRWKLVGEYFQTEDWWPGVARAIEELFDQAFEDEHRREEERQKASAVAKFADQMVLAMGANPELNYMLKKGITE